jgi:hypothetical protein
MNLHLELYLVLENNSLMGQHCKHGVTVIIKNH